MAGLVELNGGLDGAGGIIDNPRWCRSGAAQVPHWTTRENDHRPARAASRHANNNIQRTDERP